MFFQHIACELSLRVSDLDQLSAVFRREFGNPFIRERNAKAAGYAASQWRRLNFAANPWLP